MSRGLQHWLGGTTLRVCAAAAILSLLAACASTPATVATLDPKNGDGIGGTGISTAANTRGDGIGGTGIRGTITGFGSILVNGLKLDFDHKTTVVADGKPVSLEALRVGQIVQGVARAKDGKLSLATLEIQHAVTGPLSAIDYAAQTLTVLGQNVRVNLAGDAAAIAAFRTLQAGDVVSVSGLRQADGTIVATRVDETSHDDRTLLRGVAASVTASSMRVGDLDVSLPAGTAAPQAGERVFVAGRMINGRFMADMVSGTTPLAFGEDVKDVSLEAYAPSAAGGSAPLVIDGISVGGAALPAGTVLNDRIVVTGEISGPASMTAKTIGAARTVVTINTAKGSLRPAAIRPESGRPERVAPRPNIDRPQGRPDTPSAVRPPIERPQGVPMV
jgi:hypothetical protein